MRLRCVEYRCRMVTDRGANRRWKAGRAIEHNEVSVATLCESLTDRCMLLPNERLGVPAHVRQMLLARLLR